jgi:hypothetical protein
MILYSYLKEVLVRFKYWLGGGSGLLIIAGIAEHFLANSITWAIYIWLLVAGFVITLVRHGADQYKRLLPRIVIRNLTRRVWPAEQHGFTGAEYYFEIFNSSDCEPLENVRAELISMQPDPIGYLPVPLRIKHDDYEVREFSINPASTRMVDLITGPVDAYKSQREMVIAHTVSKDRIAIPRDKYRLTVRVGAKNSPPVMAVFETWVEGPPELRCIQL